MSRYLSCVFECESIERTKQISELIDRHTRPIFEEDVPSHLDAEFAVIDELEFPDALQQQDHLIVASWFDKNQFDLLNLRETLNLQGINLIIANQVESYEGSEDEDEEGRGYWFDVDGRFTRLSATDHVLADFTKAIELMEQQDQK